MGRIQLDSPDTFLPPLSVVEEKALFAQYAALAPCQERDKIRERIIRSNLRYAAKYAIVTHRETGVPVEEIYGEAKLSMLEAFSRFDPSHGTKFLSYAASCMHKAFTEAYRNSQMIRSTMSKSAAEKLQHNNPRAFSFASLDQEVTGTDDLLLLDTIADPTESVIESMEVSDKMSIIRVHMESLALRDQGVISLYYGLDGSSPMTLEEISKRLRITRERCRQIKERALTSLHKNCGTLLK